MSVPRSVQRLLRASSRRPAVVLAAVVLGALCVPAAHAEELARRLVAAARVQTTRSVIYDGAYRALAYPGGDVPADRGVCTDVVIRAYRAALGIDLQVLVHEDMAASFSAYPALWGLSRPDRNIDHRRVPNLQRFFTRKGVSLPIARTRADHAPGDLVTWRLPGNQPHIGIVSDRLVPGTQRRQIIHNIGAGPVEDDILLEFEITGHYRFLPQ